MISNKQQRNGAHLYYNAEQQPKENKERKKRQRKGDNERTNNIKKNHSKRFSMENAVN